FIIDELKNFMFKFFSSLLYSPFNRSVSKVLKNIEKINEVFNMKIIGLIGGMSWESSAEYYRIINEEVKRRLGGLHSAKCILYSVDFAEIERFQNKGEWEKAGAKLNKVARSLEKAGADFLVICTNTIHKVVENIQTNINIPILHIADATAKQINERELTNIGLLGTK